MSGKRFLLAVALISLLFAQISIAQTYKLDLLYAVVSGTPPEYDNAEHWKITTSFRIFMTKEGQNITVYLLTCYINTGDLDTRKHLQKVELVSPDGEKVITTVTNPVELVSVGDKNTSLQRAYVVAKINIPAMNTAVKENFGLYTIKIYLDGDLVMKYPYPILAR